MKNKTIQFAVLMALAWMFAGTAVMCKRPTISFADRLTEGRQYDSRDQTVSRAEDAKSILTILRSVFASVEGRDLSTLPQWIDTKKGVYVDLKALRTSRQFSDDLADPSGYVNTYYLNSDELRKRTGDSNQKSLLEVISNSREIRADFYFQGDECEVRLNILGDQSSESYRFNNPYFIKQDGRWFLYRLP